MNPVYSIIGLGYWGKILLQNMAQLGLNVKHICDINPTPGVTTNNIDDILNDNEVTAVLVSVPPHSHFSIGEKVLRAGKHLFIEKPLALNIDDSLVLVRLAQEKNLLLMVDQTFIYSPEFFFLKQVFKYRMFGRNISLESRRANLGPFKTDVNVVWDLLPHDLSIILPLNNKITSIYAAGNSNVNKGVIDNVDVLINFQDGFRAKLFASWINPIKTRLLQLTTEKGIWSYDSATLNPPNFNNIEVPLLSYATPLQTELNTFHHRIKENDLTIDSDTHNIIFYLTKIEESIAQKAVVHIP
jgi:predicted dehydrogenase